MAVTMTADQDRQVKPLSEGETAAVWMVAIAVGMLGILGFVNSFAAVAHAAKPSFGTLAPTVPLGIDLAIAVFSAIDIVLARLDMRPPWVRWIPWGLTAATVYLNVADQKTWFGRIAHAVLICLWVLAVSLAAHVARVRAQLDRKTRMDRIRPSRWLLAPAATVRLWRRMVLWEERSYPAALARERARLLARTGLQDTYGAFAWRWRAPRRERVLYRLGEHTPAPAYGPSGPGPDEPAPRTGDADRTARTARTGDEPRPEVPTAPTVPVPELDKAEAIARVAADIRTAIEAGERWRPDRTYYEALMAWSGNSKSWCEKVVRAARLSVLDPPERTARTEQAGAAEDRTGRTAGPDEPDGDTEDTRADERVLAVAGTA